MAVTQERNPEMVDLLTADFQRRYEPNFAWGNISSNYLQVPGLRGYWPFSAIDGSGNAVDLAQGNNFTNNNACVYYKRDLAPYIEFSGANNLSAANAAWNQIIGNEAYINSNIQGLTIAAWVYFDNAAAATEQINAKQNGAGAANIAWSLYRTAAGVLSLTVSNGVASETVSTTATLAANTWYHVSGVVDIANTLKYVYINGAGTSNALALATINNLASTVAIGARDNGAGGFTAYQDGLQSNHILCAAALSASQIQALYQQSRAMFGV